MPTEPAPIKVETSGQFSGNDGAWSSVKIRVGNPPQEFEVFPATEIPETWVVLATGCSNASSNCTALRGGTFNTSKSPTWDPKDSLYELGAEQNLGIATKSGPDADVGLYGFDTLGVQESGGNNISLNQQVVVGINTTHFYRGNLGLATRPIIFGDTTTSPGFLQSLKDQNLIPSLSYGYTAGASYRPSNASLTLGGYDVSRFTSNNVVFTLAPTSTRELVVGVDKIVSVDSSGKETTLRSEGFLALVDSTVPHMWLPLDACQAFETTLGLSYDAISNLYLVNDTLHDTLVKQNASIVLQISSNGSSGPSVNITLPYASFDLEVQAGYPLITQTSRYFPLRQARDPSQYTLGRTFLQESFLSVNYENKQFSISQAIPAPDSASHIVAISLNNATSPTPSSLPQGVTKSSKSHSLSTGAIVGIAIAIVLVALVVGGILLFFNLKKRRERNKKSSLELDANPPPPRDRAELSAEEERMSGSTIVKLPNVDEAAHKDQDGIDQQDAPLMKKETAELDVPKPELASPDPNAKHEMPTSDAPPRSELSTPEPIWPVPKPMPSQEPRADIFSAETAKKFTGDSLPSADNSQAPISIMESTPGAHQAGSQKRPTHVRVDSSESESGWNKVPVPVRSRPSVGHSRVVSSESESGWVHNRMDSSDSEISNYPANVATDPCPQHRSPSTDSIPISPEQATYPTASSRPAHRRFNSNDSGDTLETRLEMFPNSPYFPSKHGQPHPIQAIPSLGIENPLSALSSPSLMSTRSGLLSPEPLEMDEEEEMQRSNSRGQH